MRLGGAAGTALISILLMLLFTAFNGGLGTRSMGGDGLGGFGKAVVSFRVEMIDEEGVRRPVEGAEVVVGLESRRTGASGEAEIILQPGLYSSYVRTPDLRVAPLLTRMEVNGEVRVDVLFELRRLPPSSVRIESDGNSTRIVMEVKAPGDAYRAYIAEPVIGLFNGEGLYVSINQGDASLNAFATRLEPNATRLVEVVVAGHTAILDAKNTYIPLELIKLKIEGRDYRPL